MAEGEERPWGGGDDENGKYPIGFRFKPTTEEIVEFYLLPKLVGELTVPNEFVIEADAYKFDPEILTEKYKESSVDDTWFFLSPRSRKYRGGDRPVRRTDDNRGRWKPSTGQSKPPEEEESDASTSHPKPKRVVFSENTLAYHVGPPKGETKTKWLMHELVVPETPDNGFHGKSAAAAEPRNGKLPLNRFVVCRIYKSPLRKWKELEEAEAEAAAAAEVPTSSQLSSVPAPECVGEEAATAPSPSRQPPAKRPAVERPAPNGHTGAPSFPGGGRSAPTRGNVGGSSVRMPPAGAGAVAGAAGQHGPAGLPALVHWSPVYPRMQAPVQVQQPPWMYWHSNRAAGMPNANGNGHAAPGQGLPALRQRPPHWAAATAPNSHAPTMMRPPHLATGQPAWLPFPRQQQPPPPPETEEAYRNRVYARLIAEMKLQKAQEESAARAGQQQINQAASTQPACFHDEGANLPVGAEAMVVPVQFPAPHGAHAYSSSSNVAQPPQRQQSSSANPAAAENVSSKKSMPPGANEGWDNAADDFILQILAAWPL